VIVYDQARSEADGFELASDLDQLLARVDILSLHCPLTEQTRSLIGRAQLALLKPGALLINTARGPIIDEAAMIDALRSGHLAGAGLDTFETEPIPTDSPLLGLDNVILTPHVAGVTRNAALQVATITARNVVDALAGRSLPHSHLVAGPATTKP
jgi:D-3-phosphoglycerate dehydrogenase